MESNVNSNVNARENTAQDVNQVDLRDLILLCVNKWYWFVISVIVCLSAVNVYLLITPPKYTRTAEILIKSDRKGKSIASTGGEFADLGLVNTVSKVNNEIHAIGSVSNITEVVRRLRLNTNYHVDGRFHDIVLYGTSLPVVVISPEGDLDMARTFDIILGEDETFTLSNFTLRGNEVECENDLSGTLGDTLVTPVGPFVVEKSQFYERARTSKPIHVSMSGIYNTTMRYRGAMSVARSEKDSDVIAITINDISIQRAEDILNTVIEVYNERWVEDKNQIASSTSEFIAARLQMIERDLSNVDSDISTYKSANLISDVAQASSLYMTQSSNIESRITELQNQLYMAKYVREYLSSERLQILPANALISDASLGSQINDYNTKLIDRNNLVAASSENNPLVKEIDSALEALRTSIISAIDNEILSLNNQINSFTSTNTKTKQKLAANPTQTKYLLSVERQQSVKEALYIYLLQKREENELSQAFTAYNTQIINPPYGSGAATFPARSKLLLIGLLLGLCIPVAFIYVGELLNTRVRGKADIKSLTLPFLGEIPLVYGEKKKIGAAVKSKKRHDASLMVVKHGGRDVVNEAFRVVRTNVEFISHDKNVMVVTSMNPGSGKSFITMNLAMSFAVKGNKVLVVDGDFRRAGASQYVDKPKVGFSNYLAGQRPTYKDTIVAYKNQDNLYVLPIGTIPPNPTELISSPKFGMAVSELRNEYDMVFIDCPPVEIMADTQMIDQFADRTLFIIRTGLFERSMLPELQKMYESGKLKNMALILNGAVASGRYGSRYGYHYGYNYGYRYGYHYGYGSYGNDKA